MVNLHKFFEFAFTNVTKINRLICKARSLRQVAKNWYEVRSLYLWGFPMAIAPCTMMNTRKPSKRWLI
ncbi:hypothetical protein ACE1AT_09650 [Pelatocladus sp. BLCC-F211]|uniref:hypothetical protein n=1 Tax=Pelatocladus sp. BLCC-F211 TaxID=3342752 RepID=UPI0035B7F15B